MKSNRIYIYNSTKLITLIKNMILWLNQSSINMMTIRLIGWIHKIHILGTILGRYFNINENVR